jgi:hypothetical protein
MDVKLHPPLIVLPKNELTALMPFGEYVEAVAAAFCMHAEGRSISGQNETCAVSCCTEAGLFQDGGAPAIICGPATSPRRTRRMSSSALMSWRSAWRSSAVSPTGRRCEIAACGSGKERHHDVDHAGTRALGRVACPWLIKKFVDKDAVPRDGAARQTERRFRELTC